MSKLSFENPELLIIEINPEDILTSSGDGNIDTPNDSNGADEGGSLDGPIQTPWGDI